MTNTPTTTPQYPASSPVESRKAWKRPTLDMLELPSAEVGHFHVNDRHGAHKSA